MPLFYFVIYQYYMITLNPQASFAFASNLIVLSYTGYAANVCHARF